MKLRIAALNISVLFGYREVDGQFEGFEGYEYAFLKILSGILNFGYEILRPDSFEWGSEQKNGTWTGLYGMLQQGKADIVIQKMPITDTTKKIVDYSFPYNFDGISFAVKVAEEAPKDFVFLYPFEALTWIFALLTFLVCAAVLYFYRKVKRKETSEDWMSTFELLNGSRSLDFVTSKQILLKVFLACYLLPMSVLIYSYKGVFLSFLMAPVMEPQVSSLNDLISATQKGTLKIYAFQTIYDLLFKHQNYGDDDPIMAVLDKDFEDHKAEIASMEMDLLRLLKNNSAYISTTSSFEYIRRDKKEGKYMYISPENFRTYYFGIAYTKGFRFKNKINPMIHRVQQAGIYTKLVDDYMFKLVLSKQTYKHESVKVRSLRLSDLVGALWMVLPCYVLSIFVLPLEIFYFRIAVTKPKKLKRGTKKKKKKKSVVSNVMYRN